MKTLKIIVFTVALAGLSLNGYSQTSVTNPQNEMVVTDSFTVYGNCGMCKSRIETAVNKLEGIQSANWDVDSKLIKVTYDESVISLDEINLAIASAGHDTQYYKAKTGDYHNLPVCCQYERKKE